MDHYMWRQTFTWARRSHGDKSRHWVVDRCFGRFHPSRRDRWVIGDRDSGAFLIKFAWNGILRHQFVKGGTSPADPALVEYRRDRRRRKAPPPMDKTSPLLAVRQQGAVLSASKPPSWMRTHAAPKGEPAKSSPPPTSRADMTHHLGSRTSKTQPGFPAGRG
ncbi:hypothetical protein [Streptomyces noursei]|uniref:hypothetical protein n=1 Tax=Streptomyces noursei TaxID=1971 RepID=UPI0023B773DE|nr:hypothetical protein [Streptomyces noursei]